ncbi:ATP-grasp domain-containing protein [Vibrio ostreae]|uniref:ATP-grasp domain-containing protein n=1 Tax=Vibrio ostreae TaxID=2841925 RepID=A0A975U8S3_9VIBR|nr:ATP-grasp domain-containing protein [Vibrio ostreae]QXO17245.1 ATP-grasp domain-containing protein [Vibrio ostreae]
MKNFLVLGIGNAQVDLLRYLKLKNEFCVYALSNSMEGRGYQYADKFDLIDITDKEAVLQYALENNINYIYSIGSDVAMPTVAYVAEKLSLPCFVNYTTALTCNNKDMFRKELADCYGSVPHVVITSLDQLDSVACLRFPVIVKPVDSQGQRGVGTAASVQEVKALYDEAITHSRSGKVIVEEKIEGEEISVNAYVSNSELVFSLSSGRVSWPQFDGGVIHKHFLPSAISEVAEANVQRLVKKSIAKLDITNGPVYFQIKMNGDEPYLIEVTPRFDGCHMWKLIKEANGIDLLNILVNHLMGEAPKLSTVSTSSQPFILEFHCFPPEHVFVTPEKDDQAVYEELYYCNGDTVRRMNGKMEKCGYKVYPSV